MILAGTLFLVSALSAVGLGSILARTLGIKPNAGERGFLGLLSFGLVGALVHFFWPISAGVQNAVLLVGLVGLVAYRRSLGGIVTVGLAALAFVCVFLHARPGPLHDNGLYHMPTILWNTQAPLVPGVVNLHGRLAFNSLFFLIEPFVDRLQYGFIGNSLTTAFFLLAAFDRLLLLRKEEGNPGGFWFLSIAVGAFVSTASLTPWLGQTDTDHFAAVLITYWTYLMIEYELGIRPETAPSLLLLLAVFAFMSKLSAAQALGVTLVLFVVSRRAYASRRVTVAVAAFLLIWCTRGFLQSGCVLYPVQQTCVAAAPWAADRERVEVESDGARAYARVPGTENYKAVLANWNWFRPWWVNIKQQRIATEWLWGLAIGLVGLVYRVFLRMVGVKFPSKFDFALGTAAIAQVLGILYWFWAAPDPRFGLGFLSSFAILGASFAAASALPGTGVRRLAVPPLFALFGCWTLCTARNGEWARLPVIPTISVLPRAAPGGHRIWVPTTGDQCWDTPIPCIPGTQFAPEGLTRVHWRPFKERMPAKVPITVKLPLSPPIRVDAGGADMYTDSAGHVWTPDVGYQNGNGFATDAIITGTPDPALYRTERYVDNGSLLYELTVPNGDYTVVLRFAEYAFQAPGERLFDVCLNGTVAHPRLDLFVAAGGVNKAFDLKYPLHVTTNLVQIKLTAVVSKPVLSAFEILPVQ